MVAEIMNLDKPLRQLVSVRHISALNPIPDADAIEVATVDGWKLVVKKGEFTVGESCVYFEIDSFLPESDERYAFLMKNGVREFEGVRGHKLRTIKLRGQVSQGLALPLKSFPEIIAQLPISGVNPLVFTAEELAEKQAETSAQIRAMDFSEVLGIKKWEAAIPAELAGQVKGLFPSFMRKTDQERCQNLLTEIFVDNKDARYEVTMKLDGTSVTMYHRDGEVGVCSRNLELKVNEENAGNSLVKMLLDSGMGDALKTLGHNIAIQGELMGPGIQKNREQLKTPVFYIFDIQALDAGIYLTPVERSKMYLKLLFDFGVKESMVQHVPILHDGVTLAELGISNVDELLNFADGPSITHPVREGLVFKKMDGTFSFKSISNLFLQKEKD